MNVYSRLDKLVREGYLLHGSRFSFNEATPNRREDVVKGGKMKAIYTTDVVDLAMFKAVADPTKVAAKDKIRMSVHNWQFLKDGGVQFWVSKNYVDKMAFSNGFVYVFKAGDFKQLKKLPHEYYSMNVLKPIMVVEIAPKDFFEKNKVIIWPKEKLEKSGRFTKEEISLMGY